MDLLLFCFKVYKRQSRSVVCPVVFSLIVIHLSLCCLCPRQFHQKLEFSQPLTFPYLPFLLIPLILTHSNQSVRCAKIASKNCMEVFPLGCTFNTNCSTISCPPRIQMNLYSGNMSGSLSSALHSEAPKMVLTGRIHQVINRN